MTVHEEAFVKAFVEPTRQERFLGFLADPRKRVKFIDEFNHLKGRFLVPKFMTVLSGTQSLPANVYATLRKMGAPEKCWAMGGRFDGQEKELSEALQESGDGFALSCIPGELAYMKTEDDEYILRR